MSSHHHHHHNLDPLLRETALTNLQVLHKDANDYEYECAGISITLYEDLNKKDRLTLPLFVNKHILLLRASVKATY